MSKWVEFLANSLIRAGEQTEQEIDSAPRNETPSGEKSPKKLALGILAASLVGPVGLVPIVAQTAYDKLFGRYDRPDYSVVAGQYEYGRISNRLSRECVHFDSDGVRLAGYLYRAEQEKALVVFAHGLHAGADDYLPVYEYMIARGYSVFSFDVKGTYDSDGSSTVGLGEAFIDMDHAINYVKSRRQLADLPLFVLGHSCGAYAAVAVTALHDDILACAAIAPMENAFDMVFEKGSFYSKSALPLVAFGVPLVSEIATLTQASKPILTAVQKQSFSRWTKDLDRYWNVSGVDAINSRSIPYLIAHGDRDMVVDYASNVSLIGNRNDIRNPMVQYYVGHDKQSGHDTIWHSDRAVEYQDYIEGEIKKVKKHDNQHDDINEVAVYCMTINHALFSEINEELFDKIATMFDTALVNYLNM